MAIKVEESLEGFGGWITTMPFVPDLVNGLLVGGGGGAAVGALLDRRLDSPWQTVLADAGGAMVGGALAVFVSYSSWIRNLAANRSVLVPDLESRIAGVVVDEPLIVAGAAAFLMLLIQRGIRSRIHRKQGRRP